MIKKVLAIIALLFVLVIVVGAATYHTSISPKYTDVEKGIEIAEKNSVQIVEKAYVSYGNEAHIVVTGKNSDNKNVLVWINKKTNAVITKLASEGISEQQAIASLKKDYRSKEIISVKLGMEKEQPLWELTYINEQGKYSFYYIYWQNGSKYMHITL